jgi:hypothetical protein
MSCYVSYKQKELLKTADYLLKQNCCDAYSCSQLVDDLQDTQFKCNDIFGKFHLDKDEKGNIEQTVCSNLRDKKNEILKLFKNQPLGGNKNIKKRTIKRNKKMQKRKGSKRNRKMSRNKTNTRKTR